MSASLLPSPVWPFHFALIHRSNIPGSYAVLLFIALDLTSITSHIHHWCCFCFGSISSFILELFLHGCPVSYWAPTNLGSLSFNVLSFCLILFMGFSRQEYWSGLPFPSPVDHILPPLHRDPSWVDLHGMTHSFIETDKAVVQVIRVVRLLWLWFLSVCSLMPLSQQLLSYWSFFDLGCGVSPQGPCSWSWTWGISSPPLISPAPRRRCTPPQCHAHQDSSFFLF